LLPFGAGRANALRCSATRDPVRRPARDRGAIEGDAARARRHEAHERANQGRLAHAVAAEHADDRAGGDVEVDAEQDLARAVAGTQAADLEQRRDRHACSSPR
jgi:hypothetical protein